MMGRMPNLRTSWIWHGDVLDDIVHRQKARVTLGLHDATFVTPGFDQFVVLEHDVRGTQLHLVRPMTGVVVIAGERHDIATLVAHELVAPALALSVGDEGVISLDGGAQLVFSVQPSDTRPRRSLRLADARAPLAAGVFSIVLHAALLASPSESTASPTKTPAIVPSDLVTILDDPPTTNIRVTPVDARTCVGTSRDAGLRTCPMLLPPADPEASYVDDEEPPAIGTGIEEMIGGALRGLALERCARTRERASRIVLELTLDGLGRIDSATIHGAVDGRVADCIRGKLRSARIPGWANRTVEWPLAPPA
jgi:hypothetical protein